jgi:tRNA(Ile)-lysidine synthase
VLIPDEIFAPHASARGLLVAVSGGPDSIALLALAAEWSKGDNRPPVFAATFDHGFRKASRAEAELCAALCARLGVPHRILEWHGEKPETRIQESARDARYAALVEHAKAIGADLLLTAHHADDQMETILFRLMRGSSIGGLAGMRALTRRGGIVHARPLLAQRKAALVAYAKGRDLPFVIDPTNADPRFARTGLRRLAPQLEEAGLGPEIFARLAMRAERADAALDWAAQELAQRAILSREAGQTQLAGRQMAEAPEELALRLLLEEMSRLDGRPRLEQAEPLLRSLREAARENRSFRANLAGLLIDLRRDGTIVIAPEPARQS